MKYGLSLYEVLKEKRTYIVEFGDPEDYGTAGPFDSIPDAREWVKTRVFKGVPFIIYEQRLVRKGVR